MKVIYVHHADRDRSNKSIPRFSQDITENGIKEANLLGLKLEKVKDKVIAIYTSPYLRCRHTADIINKYINAPIYDEERFNEMQSGETYLEFQKRNMEAIDKIVKKYDNDDNIVICVTSGVNLGPFVFYFNGIKPSNNNTWVQGITCSPVLFTTDGKVF